jgi:hypothetical protein
MKNTLKFFFDAMNILKILFIIMKRFFNGFGEIFPINFMYGGSSLILFKSSTEN